MFKPFFRRTLRAFSTNRISLNENHTLSERVKSSFTQSYAKKSKIKNQANIKKIFSYPVMPVERRNDYFMKEVVKHQPDIVFLQVEPLPYMFRMRKLAQAVSGQLLLKPEFKYKISPEHFE